MAYDQYGDSYDTGAGGEMYTPGSGAPVAEQQSGSDPYGEQSTPSSGEYTWDTPMEVYEFGRQRLGQMIDQLRTVGAAPVAKQADYRSELGGRLKGWESYNAATALAGARYNQQMQALRLNLKYLEERMQYQHPITDLF